MKSILILCRRDDRDDYDTQRSMLRSLQSDETAEYSGADYEDLLFHYDGSSLSVVDTVSGRDISDFSVIFLIGWFKTKALDDVARAVTHYAKAKGVKFANTEAFSGRSFTKLSQCVIAALNGVRVTPFVFSLDGEIILNEAKSLPFSSPYIAKAVATSRGRDNYLIRELHQLEDAIREVTEPPRFFILQEFVPNDGDYRVIVANKQVKMVIHRLAQDGGHVNNTSQGGKATLVDPTGLPQKVINDSIKMAELLGRQLTGVDMIMHRDTGEYFFLEANNMPQLSTGSFVQEKMKVVREFLDELSEG